MSDHADSSPSPSDDANPTAGESLASLASSRTSILGLSVVSLINLGCIAFIAFHYYWRDDQPLATETVDLRAGNVKFEPVSANLITIASHVEPASPLLQASATDQVVPSATGILVTVLPDDIAPEPLDSDETLFTPLENSPSSPAEIAETTTPVNADSISDETAQPASEESDLTAARTARSWVQLGALSNAETAHTYWKKLRDSNKGLLGHHQPVIVEPEQAGGSLYHLRVGPFDERRARNLCLGLEEAGVDCFYVDMVSDDVTSLNKASSLPGSS